MDPEAPVPGIVDRKGTMRRRMQAATICRTEAVSESAYTESTAAASADVRSISEEARSGLHISRTRRPSCRVVIFSMLLAFSTATVAGAQVGGTISGTVKD